MRARYYAPALGRFIQPDTIVPLASQGVQAWDRYAYVNNSPTRYTDPSGHVVAEGCGDEGKSHCHASDLEKSINAQKLAKLQHKADERSCRNGNNARCSGLQGFQIQFTLTAGFDTELQNLDGENVDPLLFYGISLVFDKHGGFQIFGLTRDIQLNPYSTGSAEDAYPMNYAGASLTLSAGSIGGTEFAARGTEAYAGQAVDWGGGYGNLSADHYEAFDENTGKTDLTKVSGDDIGLSEGFIVSGGQFATVAQPLFNMPRIGLPIRDPYDE